MKKLNNSNVSILIIVILTAILIVLSIRLFMGNRQILAYVSSTDVIEGIPIQYKDSTNQAKSWTWEFGNGDISNDKSGSYTYRQSGTYKIRLTVDNSLKQEFKINVKEPIGQTIDSLVRIDAPIRGLQDEVIIFRGQGFSKEWRWSMGETGIIDSRERVAFYTYKIPGLYDVELMTEDTKYPVVHRIQIDAIYLENDSTDVLSLIGNDIRIKLQAIADGKPFNPNYNHILKKYLCNNAMVVVTVNNEKKNDFYSYCQGLRTVGLKHTVVQDVIVVQGENNPDCLDKLYVTQYSID